MPWGKHILENEHPTLSVLCTAFVLTPDAEFHHAGSARGQMNIASANRGVHSSVRLKRCIRAAFFLLLALFTVNVSGQQPQSQQQPQLQRAPESKIAVEVKAVSVLATVRDKHGKIISNLTKDDFVLEEDGRLRQRV